MASYRGPWRALARHKLVSRYSRPDDFVFATRLGGALGQTNVGRALRKAQRDAVDEHSWPTFPVLHEVDADGGPVRAAWSAAIDAQLPSRAGRFSRREQPL